MSKLGSHEPFEHLQHKLWRKERSGVKLTVWLSTIKSRESTRPHCVQVECNTLLESSQRGLELCFRPHHDQRSAQKLCTFKVAGVLIVGISGLPLGSPGTQKKAIWMWPPWRAAEYTIWGKVVASPESRPWWVLWVQNLPWPVLAPKVL
jgi:hypothetical protein